MRVIEKPRAQGADERTAHPLSGARVRSLAVTAEPVALRPWPYLQERQRRRSRKRHPDADPNRGRAPGAAGRIGATALLALRFRGNGRTTAQTESPAQTAQYAKPV